MLGVPFRQKKRLRDCRTYLIDEKSFFTKACVKEIACLKPPHDYIHLVGSHHHYHGYLLANYGIGFDSNSRYGIHGNKAYRLEAGLVDLGNRATHS
ncbi:hypothetical protein AAIB41_01210 [Brucella sp. BE17]|uniref:hypothetical protein n=1 Tax=Brucella sp. BE17 TaxID=3142977 RepID=UPI0031BA1950